MPYSKEALDAGRELQERVIRHAAFDLALDHIVNALEIGNGTGVYAGVRITAPAGSGKSLLIKCLHRNIVASPLLANKLSVISTELKEEPSVSQVQDGLLANFGYGLVGNRVRAKGNNDMNKVLLRAIVEHEVKLIAIDEFQHVFSADSERLSVHMIDWVKRLMNLTRVPVVLVGTELMDQLSEIDPQFTSRVPTSIRLPRFEWDANWLGFLAELARSSTHTDLSIICDRSVAKHLYEASKGLVRPLKSLLVQVVTMAVSGAVAHVDAELLAQAYTLTYGEAGAPPNPFRPQ